MKRFAASALSRVRPPLLGPIAAAALAAIAVAVAAPAIAWLPPAGESRGLFGPLLGAQAAFAALTLAVANFVMEGVRSRRGADSRTEREYFRRARAGLLFGCSVAMVGLTGAAMLAAEFGAAGMPFLETLPGLRNLLLAAAASFAASLALGWLLFRRAIRAAWPDQWRALRREVGERDVRAAMRAWASRRQARPAPELFVARPEEALAGAAVRSLRGDARRAMDEHREDDFSWSLDSIAHLVECAMDEIERRGIDWKDSYTLPLLSPPHAMVGALDPLRKAVLENSGTEYRDALQSFDFRLYFTSIDRRRAEMFALVLRGYRATYRHALRSGDADRFRGMEWRWLSLRLEEMDPGERGPYLKHAAGHYRSLLAGAMEDEDAAEFGKLLIAFRRRTVVADPELEEALRRLHRITLMGIADYAMDLAAIGQPDDPAPYIDAARGEYPSAELLASDAANAGAPATAFFCLRLIELAADPLPELDLGGKAGSMLDQFDKYANRIGQPAHIPGADLKSQRGRARAALEAAAQREEAERDHEIIARPLSEERVAAFANEVYATVFAGNAVEWAFARAGAVRHVPADAEGAPGEIGLVLPEEPRADERHAGVVSKELFADDPGGIVKLYRSDGARKLASDVFLFHRLCDLLAAGSGDAEPQPLGGIDSEEGLLAAIDAALGEMGNPREAVAVLAGGWGNVLYELGRAGRYRMEYGRWRGRRPVLSDPEGRGERRLYVFEPGSWGCFVRAPAGDGRQDLRIAVRPVTEERATELLGADPDFFSARTGAARLLLGVDPEDLPSGAEAKRRKLRTCVEIAVGRRAGFRVLDPSRALCVRASA